GVALASNPWNASDPDIGTLTQGSSTQGGSAAVVAKKERAAGTVYVVINIEQHTSDFVGTLVDIIEVKDAETGLVVVDADAIGEDMVEYGRVVLDGIMFEFDKAALKPESKPALDAIAEHLAAYPDKNFYVVGHTDSKGTFAYNNKLSSDRARAVVDALRKNYDIASSRLESHGVGPLVPVFSNITDNGRNLNRRVELVER
ncbi:MAG: OmpA family protein, partial [Gammaproteobacteria bacterium]|nr:OmpA family protein [Gammaproteobacteria bacterium]